MLTEKQLKEIRDHLETSVNPLFFFDNDVDGLCAFLILRRAIGRGRGIPIKSFPDLKDQYLKKVDELSPDTIFILDKAEVSKEFIEGAKERGTNIVWIDHHETKTSKEIINNTNYYNTFPSSEPTTYVAQKIFNNKEDLWLAMIGCIGDVFMPEFAEKYSLENPEVFDSSKSAFDALFVTEIGKAVKILTFGLMDTTTNVVQLIKFLFKARSIHDILEENVNTKMLHKRYKQLNDFYIRQIQKAETELDRNSNIIIFSYSGTSMSSQIANGLYFRHKDKLIIVAFKRPDKINISIRGKNALQLTKKVLSKIEGSSGGGHPEATGAMIPVESWERFKDEVLKLFL
jgi:oligoribonuclease NrnB/cAMP/cGMP phosphodiesterase (DHH superfamily)